MQCWRASRTPLRNPGQDVLATARHTGPVSPTAAQRYAERFQRVFKFIDRHLAEELGLERVARVAHFSPFHFHRQFAHYTGLPLGRYVHLARLRRAAHRLAYNPLERVSDIAQDVGFQHAESLTRALRAAIGQSPTQFRTNPDWPALIAACWPPRPQESAVMEVNIVTVEPVTVGVLEHLGPPAGVDASVQKFIDWRRQTGLSPVNTSRSFGVPYGDPDTTPPAQFRFDICGEVAAPVPPNRWGIINKTLPGGRCAVARHAGSLDTIGRTAYALYRDWLPTSGEELRGFPVYFHYVNLTAGTPEAELQTDVHLPIK
jgi:AraC family transcriptional regulator